MALKTIHVKARNLINRFYLSKNTSTEKYREITLLMLEELCIKILRKGYEPFDEWNLLYIEIYKKYVVLKDETISLRSFIHHILKMDEYMRYILESTLFDDSQKDFYETILPFHQKLSSVIKELKKIESQKKN